MEDRDCTKKEFEAFMESHFEKMEELPPEYTEVITKYFWDLLSE